LNFCDEKVSQGLISFLIHGLCEYLRKSEKSPAEKVCLPE